MSRNTMVPMLAAATLLACSVGAGAQTMQSSPMPGGSMSSMSSMKSMSGPDHGMPMGTMGGDGVAYTGTPDLQAAISLVTAGGPVGQFSITKALTAMVGADKANAEVAKLTKQYGKGAVASFVTVQNFAVDDAVKRATTAGVKFPAPMLHGTELAKRVVGLGLVDGTYYEGTQLDHLVTHGIHEAVMADIDAKYGAAADANYHKIADQAHYDLAQALGVTSVKLAAYH